MLLTRMLRENGRAYLPRYLVAFGFMAVVAACTSLSAWMMKDVINQIFVDRDRAALVWIPIAVLTLFTVKGLATYFQEVSLARIGNRFVAETQKRMYDQLLAMDLGFYQRHPSSTLITRITQNAHAARDMMNMLAVSLGRDVLTLVGLVIVMISQDPVMAAVCLFVVPVLVVGLRKLIKRIRQIARRQFNMMGMIVSAMRETAQGIRVIKAFQLEGMQRTRMFEAVHRVETMNNQIVQVRARVSPLTETMAGVAISLVILYAGWRNLSHGETPGQFFAFITALLLAADPAKRLSRLQLKLAQAAIGVQMMYDLVDAPAAEKPTPGKAELTVTRGEIRFDKVRFAYDAGTSVLDDLDLVAPAGCTTALVGISGGGKSTVFNLMQRFWTPAQGKITIDGQVIHDVTLESLRRQIALVSQDVFLFEGTIEENIKAGRQEASREEVHAAARAAHADAFIRSLSNGYETQVGELGAQISGGQRQRITLARAFLKDAPIILLDEPTSALDSETELVVQQALKILSKGRTTLVIAHRLATVLNADLIHVIDGGRVRESGTHYELLRAQGMYARLYQLQFNHEEVEPVAV